MENLKTVAQDVTDRSQTLSSFETTRANSCRACNKINVQRYSISVADPSMLILYTELLSHSPLTFKVIVHVSLSVSEQKQTAINRYLSQNNRGWRTVNNKYATRAMKIRRMRPHKLQTVKSRVRDNACLGYFSIGTRLLQRVIDREEKLEKRVLETVEHGTR